MNKIELIVHTAEGVEPKVVKIASDTTVGQLLEEIRASGAAIGEPGAEISLWVEDKEFTSRKEQKLHEHGIKHGHHLHFYRRKVEIFVRLLRIDGR